MDPHEITGTLDEVKGKTEKNYGKLRDAVSSTQEDFETFASSARRNAEEGWETTMDLIRENPGSSMGIALLVGAGIGALITAWAKD